MNPLPPLVIDLGKLKRKTARRLKKGEEALTDRIQGALDETLKKLGPEVEGKEVLPIVMLFEKKPKKRKPFSLI